MTLKSVSKPVFHENQSKPFKAFWAENGLGQELRILCTDKGRLSSRSVIPIALIVS